MTCHEVSAKLEKDNGIEAMMSDIIERTIDIKYNRIESKDRGDGPSTNNTTLALETTKTSIIRSPRT